MRPYTRQMTDARLCILNTRIIAFTSITTIKSENKVRLLEQNLHIHLQNKTNLS